MDRVKKRIMNGMAVNFIKIILIVKIIIINLAVQLIDQIVLSKLAKKLVLTLISSNIEV